MNVLLLEHPRTITNDRANDIANTPLASCLLSGYAASALKEKGHGVEMRLRDISTGSRMTIYGKPSLPQSPTSSASTWSTTGGRNFNSSISSKG